MRSAFTLIELLVVITIIVVLLALLTPALDKAIYQAELVACGGNLKAFGNGTLSYAFANRRTYFHRGAVHDGGAGYLQPRNLTLPFDAGSQRNNVNGYDDRPMMRDYLSINGLQCPLTDDVNLASAPANTRVMSGYSIWAGWRYVYAGDGNTTPNGAGMLRMGQKLVYNNERYDALGGDFLYGYLFEILGSHPDDKGSMAIQTFQPAPTAAGPLPGQGDAAGYTLSQYKGAITGSTPGLFDLNFANDDGSVVRIDKTMWGSGETWFGDLEPRMDIVPGYKDGFANGGAQLSIPSGR